MSRTILRLLLIGLVALIVSACVPVAWVLPPMQLDFGAGAGHTQPDGDVNLVVPIRLGLYPLQLFPELFMRPVDAGLGYQIWLPTDFYHGPYLEGMYLMPISQHPRPRTWRFGMGGRGHYLFAPGAPGVQGPAMSIKLLIEAAAFTNDPVTSCSITAGYDSEKGAGVDSIFCGHAYHYGETSIGFFLEGTRGWLGDENLSALTAGLTFRIPASAGAGIAVLLR
ncbi:MAG: hypothetical protein ACNA8W_00995 [Bradymonadaceae bacterium]